MIFRQHHLQTQMGGRVGLNQRMADFPESDSKVNAPLTYIFSHGLVGQGLQFKHDIRHDFFNFSKQPGGDHIGQAGRAAYVKLQIIPADNTSDGILQPFNTLVDWFDFTKQFQPFRCGDQSPFTSLEQGYAHLVFHVLKQPADTGLRHIQYFRSTADCLGNHHSSEYF